jgi:hypothetical protein
VDLRDRSPRGRSQDADKRGGRKEGIQGIGGCMGDTFVAVAWWFVS